MNVRGIAGTYETDQLNGDSGTACAIGVLVMGTGTYVLWMVYCSWRDNRAARFWPGVLGEVVGRDVNRESSEGVSYTEIKVRFEYTVDGQLYTGTNRYVTDYATESPAATQALSKTTAGSAIEVYYDPAKPHIARVEREVGDCNTSLMWGCIALLIIATGGVPLAWSIIQWLD